MDTAYPNRFTNVIVSLVLQHLPLQVDKYEEVMCIEYLERLLSSNTQLYRANLQRIVQILGSYCVYYQEEEDDSSAIVLFVYDCYYVEFCFAADFSVARDSASRIGSSYYFFRCRNDGCII